MANDFQHYFRLWKASFPQWREVRWANGYLHNAYCADCRYCCGPQDSGTPFPMPLLPAQCHERLEDDFYLLDPMTPCLDDRGCKSCGPQGCRLPRPQRPIACGLFPLVLVRDALHLYQCCPAALHLPLREWIRLGEQARDWLLTFSPAERQRLSLSLSPETLAESYIDLHLALPDRP